LLDPALTVQLWNPTTGACWEATFSTAANNEDDRFKARSD
jgi:hypothetical protein